MAQVSHREKLLEGAAQCLQEQGYARTTARDIARAADANLASIGYHFGSKEALLNEALMRSFEAWTNEIVQRTFAQGEASPLERMVSSLKLMLASFEHSEPLLVAFVESMAQAQHSEELRAQLAAHYKRVRQTIADTVRESLGDDAEQRGADPEVIASFLISICDGLTLQWLLDRGQTPTGEQFAASLGSALMIALESASTQAVPNGGGSDRAGEHERSDDE